MVVGGGRLSFLVISRHRHRIGVIWLLILTENSISRLLHCLAFHQMGVVALLFGPKRVTIANQHTLFEITTCHAVIMAVSMAFLASPGWLLSIPDCFLVHLQCSEGLQSMNLSKRAFRILIGSNKRTSWLPYFFDCCSAGIGIAPSSS